MSETQIIKEQQAKLRADLAERIYGVSEPEPVGLTAVLERFSAERDSKTQSAAKAVQS